MATRRESNLGPGTRPFDFRSKVAEFAWKGMMPDGNAAGIPDNYLRLLINGRLRNGDVLARAGQEKVHNSTLDADACVNGIFDFPLLGTPRQLYTFQDGCPGITGVVGESTAFYDQNSYPNFQSALYFDDASYSVAAAVHDGHLYLSKDNVLKRYQVVNAFWGTTQLSIAGSIQDVTIHEFEDFTHITSLASFDGKLFIGVSGATYAIYCYDGITISEDLTGLTDAPTRMVPYRETLVAGFDGSPNHIRVRPTGDPGATWSTVTPSGGTCSFLRGISYKDTLWITTGAEDLFSFDGSTLTRVPIATTTLPASCITYGVAVFDDNLYIGYEDVTAGHGKIAEYDGTTWTPAFKDCYTSDALVRVRPLIAYRNSLVAGGTTGTNINKILFSPYGTGTGTYKTVLPTGAGWSGSMNDFLVY
jgi:hypothetical protein